MWSVKRQLFYFSTCSLKHFPHLKLFPSIDAENAFPWSCGQITRLFGCSKRTSFRECLVHLCRTCGSTISFILWCLCFFFLFFFFFFALVSMQWFRRLISRTVWNFGVLSCFHHTSNTPHQAKVDLNWSVSLGKKPRSRSTNLFAAILVFVCWRHLSLAVATFQQGNTRRLLGLVVLVVEEQVLVQGKPSQLPLASVVWFLVQVTWHCVLCSAFTGQVKQLWLVDANSLLHLGALPWAVFFIDLYIVSFFGGNLDFLHVDLEVNWNVFICAELCRRISLGFVTQTLVHNLQVDVVWNPGHLPHVAAHAVCFWHF